MSSSKILEWHDDEKNGGTVALLNTSINTDKATGKETKSTTLILSAVKWINGKRMLTELTEVNVDEEI